MVRAFLIDDCNTPEKCRHFLFLLLEAAFGVEGDVAAEVELFILL
jgi:hypothetical protein